MSNSSEVPLDAYHQPVQMLSVDCESAKSAFRVEVNAELNIRATAHATAKNAALPNFIR
jgi:hypothetical protein